MRKTLPVLLVMIAVVGCTSGPGRAVIERDAEQEFKAFDANSKIITIRIRDIMFPAEGRLALADCYIQAEKTGDIRPGEKRFCEKDLRIKYRRKGGEWVRCSDSEWEEILSEDPMHKYRQER